MIAYLDSSVLLRIVLAQAGELAEWPHLQRGVTSALTRVECHRTLDRLWLSGVLDGDELRLKQERVTDLLSRFDVIPLDTSVLNAAGEPLPTPIATLDAIHLVSAVAYREARTENEPASRHPRPRARRRCPRARLRHPRRLAHDGRTCFGR